MAYEQKRVHERYDIGSDVGGTFLEFILEDTKYRFRPLNTSSGGMGMLVTDDNAQVLENLKVGDRIEMKYCTPETDQSMTLEIRHITAIKSGEFDGHYQVGLSL